MPQLLGLAPLLHSVSLVVCHSFLNKSTIASMLHTAPFAAVMHLFLFAHPALVHMAVQATPEALEKFKEFMRGLVDLLLENLERRF